MNDTISRQSATQTALDFIVEYLGGAFDEDFQKKLTERMNALPSAQQWIPCRERLPESNQCVLVSIKGEVDVDWIAVDSTGYGCWYRWRDVMSVDAWMPLPESYSGE